ncbi:MAG: ABC transporter ATP-binding protein [Acidimicrobiales bacterium]
MTGHKIVEVRGVHRSYGRGHTAVHAVAGVDLDVSPGEVVGLMGPSGCGKSTLLHLIGGLDRPDRGTVAVGGRDWASMTGGLRTERRRRTCGFVFQNLLLLPTATAYENIEVPLVLAGVSAAERAGRVREVLEQVGLVGQAAQMPDQLSGGQQQRVGIARALVHRPSLVLADEPTGSLDSATAEQITELLVCAAKAQGAAVVLVTHDPAVGAHADRIVRLHSGLLETDSSVLSASTGVAVRR